MFTEPTPLRTTSFRIHSEDPAFSVQWKGGNRFRLSGEVTIDPSAELEVSTPNDDVEISLARRSTPEHAVALIRRALPRSVSMRHEAHDDGVEVIFCEALLPAAKTPRFRVMSIGTGVRFNQLDDNKIEFLGATTESGLISIQVDLRKVTIELAAGSSANRVAALVGANLPHGFRALVDGPVVTVWKDADFFSAVA